MMITRRNFVNLLTGAAAFTAFPYGALAAKPSGRRPNVIFFYMDDLGRGMLSWYAKKRAAIAAKTGELIYTPKLETPNIDYLFKNGLSFNNAHGCMFCAPARASLLTGYNDCHGNRNFAISGSGQFIAATKDLDFATCTAEDIEACIAERETKIDAHAVNLPEDNPYLAQVFQRAGYKTAQVCKMDYGFSVTRDALKRHGWDAYFGYTDHSLCHGFYPPYLMKKEVGEPTGRVIKLNGNTSNNGAKSAENENYNKRMQRWDTKGKTGGYAPEVCHDWALRWISTRAKKREPFFLFYTTSLPHGPVAIPASDTPYVGSNASPTTRWPAFDASVTNQNSRIAFWNNADGKPLATPQTMTNWTAISGEGTATDAWDPTKKELTYLEAEYATMVKIFDRQVGEVLAKLRALKIEQNTMIVFTADNGHELYIAQNAHKRNLKGKCSTTSDEHRDIFDGNNGQFGLKWNNWEGGISVPLAVYWKGSKIKPRECNDVVSNYDWLTTFAALLQVDIPKKDGRDLRHLIFGAKPLAKDSFIVVNGAKGPCLIMNDGWKLIRRKDGAELYHLPSDPRERVNRATEEPDRVAQMLATLADATR